MKEPIENLNSVLVNNHQPLFIESDISQLKNAPIGKSITANAPFKVMLKQGSEALGNITLPVGLSGSQIVGLCELLAVERLDGDIRKIAENTLNKLIMKHGSLSKGSVILSLGNIQGLEGFASRVDEAIDENFFPKSAQK
ncbi:hypothetical protein FG297_22415 [Vibrio alginolyticus]|nr:hypothetical protein [Vibrio parahaemolyticus]EHA1078688.1 hypothetical protein [Vibrio alginolyticus]EHA1137128.1 hypothetical protein [Vibrio alginolyticus]MBM5100488.1 hypothetical protein [Vibrio parahaemolyticus]